jgi:hypothetical protein
MKRILLITGLIITAGLSVIAQNITLSGGSGSVANGDTVTVVCGDVVNTFTCHIDVTNHAATALSVKCLRTNINVVSGSTNSICWGGGCWPVNVSLSPTPAVMNPDTTQSDFQGDYKANGNYGTSVIRYRFFDMNNIPDSICFFGKFVAALGVNELASEIQASDAYPNPANNSTSISYKIAIEDIGANIIVTNLLGKQIISIPVYDSEGKIKIETGQLTEGIYFYSFVLKDKVLYTKKLIVKH